MARRFFEQMYSNLESPRFFEQTAKKELAGVLWRDALAGRSAFTEEASLGLEGLWRRALADALAGCSAFKDALAGRSAFCGNPPLRGGRARQALRALQALRTWFLRTRGLCKPWLLTGLTVMSYGPYP